MNSSKSRSMKFDIAIILLLCCQCNKEWSDSIIVLGIDSKNYYSMKVNVSTIAVITIIPIKISRFNDECQRDYGEFNHSYLRVN